MTTTTPPRAVNPAMAGSKPTPGCSPTTGHGQAADIPGSLLVARRRAVRPSRVGRRATHTSTYGHEGMNMGKHEEPKPQPDPSGDGHKPGQPPPREPGKHEKK